MTRLRHYILLIITIGLALYLPSLSNQFVWDDEEQVVTNQAVHSLSSIPQLITGSTFNSGGGGSPTGLYYKPLMSISFAIIYSLFGATPAAFHIFQLTLHLGSAILIFLLFTHLTHRRNLSLLASLIFLIHPLNIETVVYISSLQDTLYMFFGLFGLTWLALSPKLIWRDFVIVALALLFSILGKETGLLFYLLIGIYLHLYRQKSLREYLISASSSLSLYLVLRLAVARIYLSNGFFTPIATLSFWERLLNIPKIVLHYLSRVIWPQQLAISEHWIVTELTPTSFYLPLIFCIIFFTVLTVLVVRSKSRLSLFFYLWFILALGFHLQLFPLDLTVADRWFYLPLAGLLGLLASLIPRFKFTPTRIAISGILLIALFMRASVRIANWQDGLTLYSHDIQLVEDSFDLENNYGVELFRAGDHNSAKAHFKRSTQIAPTWWINWNNLGAVVEREGDLELSAIYYLRSIENGHYYLAYSNYARILIKQNKLEQAKAFLVDSLRYFPGSQDLRQLYLYTLTQ